MEELRSASLGLGMNKTEVEKMFASIDLNGDHKITLEEFVEGMKRNYSPARKD